MDRSGSPCWAAGELLAREVVTGSPQPRLAPFSAARFAGGRTGPG